MSSMADIIRKRQKESGKTERLEKLGKDMDKANHTKSERKSKKNKTVSIEIDFEVLEKHICLNHDIVIGFSNEAKLFNAFFKETIISGHKRPYGRQQYLWNAFKEVMTKHAKKIVKKVTREDVV